MAKGKSPAFQFYAADWLSSKSVKLMTNQERGIYIQLLAHEWLDKGLPMDPESLAKLADEPLESFKLAWEKVGKCFLRKDGKYHNPRLRKERAKKREFSEKMRENAEKLWRTPSKPKHFSKDAESMPKVCSISSSSTSSSTSVLKQTTDENPPSPGVSPKLTPLQRLVSFYKHLLGVGKDNAEWDRANFAKYAPQAKEFLGYFNEGAQEHDVKDALRALRQI